MTSPGPDWVEQARRFVVASGLSEVLAAARPDGGTPEGGHDDHAAECRWCPVCAGLAALRGRRPDLVEGLADVLSTAAAVLRAHAAGATPPAGGAPSAGGHPSTGAPPAGPDTGPAADDLGGATGSPPAAPVQRIDVA